MRSSAGPASSPARLAAAIPSEAAFCSWRRFSAAAFAARQSSSRSSTSSRRSASPRRASASRTASGSRRISRRSSIRDESTRRRAARHLPATLATYCETALICASGSWPLNAGIAPPPLVTWRSLVASSGFRSSRFGPTLPVAAASLSVWQAAQFWVKTCLPCAAACCVPPVLVLVVPASGVLVVSAACSSCPRRPPEAAGGRRRRRSLALAARVLGQERGDVVGLPADHDVLGHDRAGEAAVADRVEHAVGRLAADVEVRAVRRARGRGPPSRRPARRRRPACGSPRSARRTASRRSRCSACRSRPAG